MRLLCTILGLSIAGCGVELGAGRDLPPSDSNDGGSVPDGSIGVDGQWVDGATSDGAIGDAATPDAATADSGAVDAGAAIWTRTSDANGIQRLERYGANLFDNVGGYYIIGSCTGADDANNVTSQGSNGSTLRAPGNCPGAPFKMTITGSNPIHVSIEVGPLPVDYRTLSVPLDPVRDYFDTFRIAGTSYQVGCGASFTTRTGSQARFDTIPQPCLIPGVGPVGAARVVPPGAWGEISGPLGNIRRTIKSGDARELLFFRHPGTHNIEISFNSNVTGVIAKGNVVRLEEDISLTDAAVVPRTVHEAESSMIHAIGRAEADGWSASTSLDPPGALCFGPYLSLSPGSFQAEFRLMVDNNNADNLVVARIEVSDYDAGGSVVAKRDLRRMEFTAANVYQVFSLPFVSPALGHRLEWRTLWRATSYVRQDKVELVWPK